MTFSLKLDYFKTFKEVDLSEGEFLDHSGEHEGGESAELETRSVRKVIEGSFLSELDFSGRRPWWEGGMRARSTRAI